MNVIQSVRRFGLTSGKTRKPIKMSSQVKSTVDHSRKNLNLLEFNVSVPIFFFFLHEYVEGHMTLDNFP